MEACLYIILMTVLIWVDVSASTLCTIPCYCTCGYNMKSTMHAYSVAIVRHNWTNTTRTKRGSHDACSAIIEALTSEDRKL